MMLTILHKYTNLVDTQKIYIVKEGDVIFKDKLILANLISNLFYSVAYPTIHFILIKDAGQKIVSLNSIILCTAGIVFPMLWNKYSGRIYGKYGYFLSLECILYTLIAIMVIAGTITPKVYYILDTVLFALITKNIMCGNNKLLAAIYKGRDREKFDNNSNIASNLSSLIGFTLSFILTIPIDIAFVLITIGITLDNIFYYQVYKESYNYCTK